MSTEPYQARPWSDAVNTRTRDFLKGEGVSLPLNETVRARHWNGRTGSLFVGSFMDGTGELRLEFDHKMIGFGSSNDFISDGWALTGMVIEPWKGDLFGKAENAFGGLKVLVLGESTHDANLKIGDVRTFLTKLTVQGFLDGADWHFYTRVTAVLDAAAQNSGPAVQKGASERRSRLWQSLAFSNVIPVVAANFPGERPSKSLFHLCSPFLEDVFDDMEPDVVMVFGKEAWGWVNWALVHRRAAWTQPAGPVAIKGAFGGFSLHPAAGMSTDAASLVLRELMDGARKERSGHAAQSDRDSNVS